MNYQIGDFIIRLKNASMARRRTVTATYSNTKKAIAEILVQEGFLKDVKQEVQDGKNMITVRLRYEERTPVLTDVLIYSKPSLRVYQKTKNMQKTGRRGLGIEIISTSQGMMTGTEAKKKNIGGELLFKVW